MRDEVQNQMKEAMKMRDNVRLSALRYLWSEIRNAEIDKKENLDDSELVNLVMREVKKRNEAIEQMSAAGRDELVAQEKAQVEVIGEFMPEMMERGEIEGIVDEVIKSGASDFGGVMGMVMGRVKGKADGKLVAEVVKVRMG